MVLHLVEMERKQCHENATEHPPPEVILFLTLFGLAPVTALVVLVFHLVGFGIRTTDNFLKKLPVESVADRFLTEEQRMQKELRKREGLSSLQIPSQKVGRESRLWKN